MITIHGKNNKAVCYTAVLEEKAKQQIQSLCDQKEFAGCKIRIMPDVHAGMGCTIGTTMTIKDKIVPGMVGVDIGCGMETVQIAEKDVDFKALDKLIQRLIPCGREVRKRPHEYVNEINLEDLRCKDGVGLQRGRLSIGTLGGGNHFIELDRDEDGNIYLVVHSGSRRLGLEVAEYYQNEGAKALCGNARFQIEQVMEQLKLEGRYKEIEATIQSMKKERAWVKSLPKDLAYVEGQLFDDYINDMKIMQRYAVLNRKAMVDIILENMGWNMVEQFTTIHNYIDTENMILRKGSVSAQKGEPLLIPINMRDGSLLCVGKGNPDWNYSAPHGAGRLLSRSKAFKTLTLEQYKKEMEGIYSSCILRATLDESPMAYKDMNEIVEQIEPTADIVKRLKPIYNFKAAE